MKTDKEILENKLISDPLDLVIMKSASVILPTARMCSVCWGRNEGGFEHVSVSSKNKDIIPTWNDMCVLKDIFFHDEEEVYQIHPKKSEYVNMKENCLHLWKPIYGILSDLVIAKQGVEDEE